MGAIFSALLLALRQLADPRIIRLLLKTLAVSVLLFAALGSAGWFALDWVLEWAGLRDGAFDGAGGLRGALSLIIVLIAGWLLWRVIAMAVISFYADEVVLAVEARHYPEAAIQARDLPVREQFSTSLGAAGRALAVNLMVLPFALLLLVTGIGTALLFWLVNAFLLGRELQDMVWLRHRHITGGQSPIGKGQRFALGAVIAGLMLVPFANFLAPLLGAASAAHLTHRKRSISHA